MGDTAILIIDYVGRTIVLTALLCAMVKIQDLNFYFPGLLGSAVLASALDTIPYFGHYLAVPVLYLCIWKVTGASLMPDAIFTVVVSYALMFAVKVLLFTVLIGDLRPSHELHGNTKSNSPAVLRIVTNAAPAPVPANHTVAPNPTNSVKGNVKLAEEWLKEIAVKGVTKNGNKSMLLIKAGKKNYELVMDEPTAVQTGAGTCEIRLVNVSGGWATVEVNGEAAFVRIP